MKETDEEKIELIEELLEKYTENVSVNHWINAIHEDKHADLAQEIVKLFDTVNLRKKSND